MQLGAARSLEKLDNKSQEQYTGGSKNFCSDKEHRQMGQATRTTKLVLDLGKRTQGGANTSKHAYLEATVEVLSAARAFYVAFFLAHAEKVMERVPYFSEQHQEMRERLILSRQIAHLGRIPDSPDQRASSLLWGIVLAQKTQAHQSGGHSP